MTKEEVKKWYIVQIKPNSHDMANRNLERQGFETLIPTISVTKSINNKFIAKRVLVFPGYILVSFIPELDRWNSINSTYGVSKILTFNNKPAEISNDLILEIKKRYEFNVSKLVNNNLQEGDLIKMYTGAFADFFATVESLDANNRIWVLLEYAGKKHRLKLEIAGTTNFRKVEY